MTMKIAALLFVTMVTTLSVFAQGIQFFQGDWKAALAEAKKLDKIIFVDAYAEWCGPCKQMAKNVFPNEEVGNFFNKHFISMQIDMERGMGLEFAKEFPVRAYPTLFFINGDGKLVHTIVGAQSVDALLSIGGKVLNMDDKSQDYAAEYEKGNREPELVLKYIRALNKARKSSLKVANEYLRAQKDLTTTDNLKIILEAATTADSKIFDWLVQYRKQIAKVTSEEEVKQAILEACQNTAEKAVEFQNKDLMQEAIDKVKKHYPEKADVFDAETWMDFYLATSDANNYLKSVKTYAKKEAYDDARALQSLCKTLIDRFGSDKNALNLAEDLSKRAAEVGQTSVYLLIHADILNKNGKKAQAIEMAKKALELAKSEGSVAVRTAEMYLNRLQG